MPTYNRIRHIDSGSTITHGIKSFPFGTVALLGEPVPQSRKLCADVIGDHFLPYIGFGKKVEKDHDLFLDHRSWRYDNGTADASGGYTGIDGFGPIDAREDWNDEDPNQYHLVGWRPGPLDAFLSLGGDPPHWQMPVGMDHLQATSFPTNPPIHLLARTNPSKPAVDIPAFVGELKDVPRMLRVIGDNLVQTGGNAYLSWNFGWRPVLDDMRKLASVSVAVNKRILTLRKLLAEGLRKSARIGYQTDFGEDSFEFPLSSTSPFDDTVHWKVQKWTENEMWGQTRWHMPDEAKSLSRAELDITKAEALKSLLGLGLHPASLWELIPWSWLVDWCLHIQDVLELLYYRPVPVEFGGGTVCFRRRTIGNVLFDVNFPHASVAPDNRIGFLFDRSTKERYVFEDVINQVSVPGTGFHFSGYQLSILAALVASKRKLASF